MKSINKITALLLSLVLMVGALSSCNIFGSKQTEKYVANVEIKFATNDDDMKEAVYAVNNSKSTVSVDGDKIKVESSAALNGISLNDSYVYIDNILYHATHITANDKSASSLEKASMSADNRDQLLADIGTGANIGIEDFFIQDKMGEDGNCTYNCSQITDSAKESLCGIFAAKFSGLNATVALDEVYYILETVDGRDDNSVLSCSFVIGLNGKTYEITMHIYTDYDYDAKVDISAPQDSDAYKEVSYEDIVK